MQRCIASRGVDNIGLRLRQQKSLYDLLVAPLASQMKSCRATLGSEIHIRVEFSDQKFNNLHMTSLSSKMNRSKERTFFTENVDKILI